MKSELGREMERIWEKSEREKNDQNISLGKK